MDAETMKVFMEGITLIVFFVGVAATVITITIRFILTSWETLYSSISLKYPGNKDSNKLTTAFIPNSGEKGQDKADNYEGMGRGED